jgi:choline kinase
MDGIILAAGMATRLKPLTNDKPKTLIEIKNKPIIKYIIDNLLFYNIKKILIVTGFQEEKIKNYIKNNYDSKKFVFITNKDYKKTNNAYSLLLTENFVNNDFILLDSDIIFEKEIIKLLLDNHSDGAKFAIKKGKVLEEEMKVIINEKNEIVKIGKEIDIKKSYGESIGIEYIPKNFVSPLFKTLKKRIIDEKKINEFYENSFQEMINNGYKFFGIDIGKLEAIEIDYKEDLKKAEAICEKINRTL